MNKTEQNFKMKYENTLRDLKATKEVIEELKAGNAEMVQKCTKLIREIGDMKLERDIRAEKDKKDMVKILIGSIAAIVLLYLVKFI